MFTNNPKHIFLILLVSGIILNCNSKQKNNETKNNSIKKNLFTKKTIGNAFTKPPQIAHLVANDFDKNGLLDIVLCDIQNNTINIIEQKHINEYNEIIVADSIIAPAHVQVIDFDNDNDNDLIVACLGSLFPNNNKIGSIVILENIKNSFKKHIAVNNTARVADVRAADLDSDGDLDLIAAQFGYDDGETSWYENTGNWIFKKHNLQNISGAINTEIIDIDNDNDLDIVTLVSQEWEEIYCFVNDGLGNFKPKLLWGSSNEDFGSSGISIADINNDGNPDILYTNGDAFDYIPPLPRPWHGLQWLENKGNLKFKYHRICDFPGAFSAKSTDFDGDNDNDIFLISGFNYWEKPNAESLIYLENKGNTFTKHTIAKTPTHLITMDIGDFNNDGCIDLVTGGVYVYPPFKDMNRVTLWLNNGN